MLRLFKIFAPLLAASLIGCSDRLEMSDARLVQGTNMNLGEALQFLREYDLEASNMCYRVNSARWHFTTNITDPNKRRMVDEQTLEAKFDRISWRKAATFDWLHLLDPIVKRQLQILLSHSRAGLADDKYNEIHHLIAEMKEIYSQTKICPMNNLESIYCDMELITDVSKIMAHTRNPEELAYIWREWHDKVGPPMRNKFMRYVQIANQAARMNGFFDAGEEMRFPYDDPNIEKEMATSWQALQPLYKELFTYVRRKLYQKYGSDLIKIDGPLPAHLMGNMWAQDWSNLIDLVLPYPEYKIIDVTEELLRQGFTPLRLFQMAEEFYTSLGLKAMPPEFWRFSMLEKPNDRNVQCTASAWDFCNKIDYRIKQCTEINMEHLISTHHEMAHIQYYLHYSDQPYLFRDGANPGFHEGISNAVVLSVTNPVHLHRVGLYNNNTEIYEININFLMSMALKKVAFAPFAYLVDLWRYDIFKNGVQKMNTLWWQMRLQYQGIVPPFPRTDFHFDPASKRHIPADIPYMKYYFALLLEFQVHEAMCFAAGHRGPLHSCDVYRSREAGRVLNDIMKLGKSRHWKDVIKVMSRGQFDKVSSDAMVRYFQPLFLWLKAQNKDEKVIGWMTSLDDMALFQPLFSNANYICNYFILNILLLLLPFR